MRFNKRRRLALSAMLKYDRRIKKEGRLIHLNEKEEGDMTIQEFETIKKMWALFAESLPEKAEDL